MPKDSQSKECKTQEINMPDSKSTYKGIANTFTHKIPGAIEFVAEFKLMNEKLEKLCEISTAMFYELRRMRLTHKPFDRNDLVNWQACDAWVAKSIADEKKAAEAEILKQAKANQEQMRGGKDGE